MHNLSALKMSLSSFNHEMVIGEYVFHKVRIYGSLGLIVSLGMSEIGLIGFRSEKYKIGNLRTG